METILMYDADSLFPVTEKIVLIHSTSWKLFWSNMVRVRRLLTINEGLNPFYIMETILIMIRGMIKR